MRNFSPASENNKRPILDQLSLYLAPVRQVLEIGSGSGQHAIFFARHFPQLVWRSSELPEYVHALAQNLLENGPGNAPPPVTLDIGSHPWPGGPVDCIYTANSLHIMAASLMVDFFRGTGQVLEAGGLVFIYGPFKYGGEFTTASNAAFDQWLKQQDPASGIRDFETVNELAEEQGLALVRDHPMPANNQLLVFRRGRG